MSEISNSWKNLTADGVVTPHKSSLNEIKDLRTLVARDLADASIEALSDDRRFATAYNAALQISKIIIAVSGYRLSRGQSSHYNSFETVKTAIRDQEIYTLWDYFDTCRRKRNHIDYDGSDVVTNTETIEIIKNTTRYLEIAEKWITAEHSAFAL